LGADHIAVEDLGTAYGISGILRSAPFLAAAGRSLLPKDDTKPSEIVNAARFYLRAKAPRPALPAVLPAVFAKRDLGKPYRPRRLGDKLAIIRAAIRGDV
jgi:phytoene synthase